MPHIKFALKRRDGPISKKEKAKTTPANKKFYRELTYLVTKAIIEGHKSVILVLPRFVKIQKGFPRVWCIGRTEGLNYYKAMARKVLDWLCEKGHSPYNSAQLRSYMQSWSMSEKNLTMNLRRFNTEEEEENVDANDDVYVFSDMAFSHVKSE